LKSDRTRVLEDGLTLTGELQPTNFRPFGGWFPLFRRRSVM
jgi:hypothetical protein